MSCCGGRPAPATGGRFKVSPRLAAEIDRNPVKYSSLGSRKERGYAVQQAEGEWVRRKVAIGDGFVTVHRTKEEEDAGTDKGQAFLARLDVDFITATLPNGEREARKHCIKLSVNAADAQRGRQGDLPWAQHKLIIDCESQEQLFCFTKDLSACSVSRKRQVGRPQKNDMKNIMKSMQNIGHTLEDQTKGASVASTALEGWECSAPTEGASFVTNDTVSSLVIGEKLGAGNYGAVYRGMFQGKAVAIKQLIIDESVSVEDAETLAEDYQHEVEICCRMNHPNLVKFLGYTTKPNLLIIQELAEKGSLYDVFKKQQFRADDAQQLSMALDVAMGMKYLHAWTPPLIHRDLKSPNLLVDDDFRLKITDFGMTRAKAITSGQDMSTMLMTDCGTPYWCAPEMFDPEFPYNEKVDQYAYSMTLIEIATGQLPWTLGAMEVIKRVRAGKRPPMPRGVSAEMSGLIARCWDAKPAERPAFSLIVDMLKDACNKHGIPLTGKVDRTSLTAAAPEPARVEAEE